MKMQDDKALRVALLARPRRAFDFKPGDAVAYWRDQKWVKGQLVLGGRWHGPAIVIGHVGRNIILIHRKQLMRCAPEQVRPSTSEEKQLISTPHTELIGIKHMLDKCAFGHTKEWMVGKWTSLSHGTFCLCWM